MKYEATISLFRNANLKRNWKKSKLNKALTSEIAVPSKFSSFYYGLQSTHVAYKLQACLPIEEMHQKLKNIFVQK